MIPYKRKGYVYHFWKKVNKETSGDCWKWLGEIDKDGYGRFTIRFPKDQGGNLKRVVASRFAYELLVGPIPSGLTIDHLCKNRHCVNPAHLEPVSIKENIARGNSLTNDLAKRTHCPQGHAYSPENTAVYKGMRRCRVCVRKRVREYKRRKRETMLYGSSQLHLS